jgi:3-deoxy-7-phosphoheptulonate synthase
LIVILENKATQEELQNVIAYLENNGFSVYKSSGEDGIVLRTTGGEPNFDFRKIEIIPAVADVYPVAEPYKLAGRNYKDDKTIIKVGNVEVGGNEVIVIAGPCSIESEEQIFTIAEIVAKSGAKILRGGAFKPRTSPYSFQGLGEEGLKLIRAAADKNGLLVVTEVIDSSQVDLVENYTDIFQVGSRNMQNFPLLKSLGNKKKPVLLKRGYASKIDEWLMSAEYILSGGNMEVLLCERGIRTFETETRNTFDISAIPVIQRKSHLPIAADPSHAIGYRDKIIPMARAAVAAGADALMIEVHHNPEKALSDGPQALVPVEFEEMMKQLKRIAEVIGRKI